MSTNVEPVDLVNAATTAAARKKSAAYAKQGNYFYQGYYDWQLNVPHDANPHHADSEAHGKWSRGWICANLEDS